MDTMVKSETSSTVLQGGALLLGAAPAAWWMSRTPPAEVAARHGFPLSEADYAVAPPAVPEGAVIAIGIAGTAVALAGLALLVRRAATGRIGGLHLATVLLLVPLPVMAGVWWAIATAPVIGANIGFGAATVVFPVVGAVFLAAACVTGLLARRGRA
ncbi:hypothetical protein [Nocardiopsis halophila]|uniref:hypothetical protein n=1 Tax=Nocardiopsis halophila TaxID=141692 RepID=UPI00034DA8DA|nr:hypothetical protein [Nocardiopsis halophila]